jgi:hypothetical protein
MGDEKDVSRGRISKVCSFLVTVAVAPGANHKFLQTLLSAVSFEMMHIH